MLIDEVRAALASAGDPERARIQQRYMKSAMPFWGVSLPAMRKLARPLLAATGFADRPAWEGGVRGLWDAATHREERYVALELAMLPRYRRFARDPASLPLYRDLVVDGRWWDLCDEVASHLISPLVLDHPDVVETMLAWSRDDDLWLRRVAVQSQLAWKARSDVELLGRLIEPNSDDPTFWMRKAIGWALRAASLHDPDGVRAFVAAHPGLSGLSKREALRRIGGPDAS